MSWSRVLYLLTVLVVHWLGLVTCGRSRGCGLGVVGRVFEGGEAKLLTFENCFLLGGEDVSRKNIKHLDLRTSRVEIVVWNLRLRKRLDWPHFHASRLHFLIRIYLRQIPIIARLQLFFHIVQRLIESLHQLRNVSSWRCIQKSVGDGFRSFFHSRRFIIRIRWVYAIGNTQPCVRQRFNDVGNLSGLNSLGWINF